MKVNENVRKEREAILRARREDIRRRKAERERIEREEAIKAEQERIEKEKIRKYIQELKEKERIEAEEKERKERKQKIVDRIGVTLGVIMIAGGIIVFNVKVFDSFAQFFYFLKVIAVVLIALVVFSIICLPFAGLFEDGVHYTKPHRYVVTDENKDNYRVFREENTTTFVPKR